MFALFVSCIRADLIAKVDERARNLDSKAVDVVSLLRYLPEYLPCLLESSLAPCLSVSLSILSLFAILRQA